LVDIDSAVVDLRHGCDLSWGIVRDEEARKQLTFERSSIQFRKQRLCGRSLLVARRRVGYIGVVEGSGEIGDGGRVAAGANWSRGRRGGRIEGES
jgi:hypothetical protein